MKFVFCAMLCSVFAFGTFSIANAAQVTKVQVDLSSKVALLDSFIRAYAQMDTDALWEMLPPHLKKTMSAAGEAYGKKQFAASVKNNVDPQVIQTLKKLLADDNTRKQVAAEMVKEMNRHIVYANGKYYIDFLSVLAGETNDAQAAALKKPQAIDHSTPEKLIETFYLAILFDDIDLAFKAFSPATHQMLNKKFSPAEAQKQFMKGFTATVTPQMRQQLRAAFAGDMKDDVIKAMKQQMQRALVKVNNKWYLEVLPKR